MSIPRKDAELNELRILQKNLQMLDSAEHQIKSLNELIRQVGSKSTTDVHISRAPTNQYEKEYGKYTAEQQKKKSAAISRFLTVAIVLLLIMGIGWLCTSGIFTKDTYLHTPEIIQEYSGIYYTISGHQLGCKLNITSCDEDGAFGGTFEFTGKDQYTDRPVRGEYAVTGRITSKSREGYVNATLKFKEWIDHPSGYNPLKDMQIKIYDGYNAIRGFDYNMCLYAADYKQPASVTDLYTPEIIGTYSGEFTPNTGKVGTASITIETCDASGQVTGIFDYSFEQGKGKWKLTGQITKKYDNGSLTLTLKPSEEIANSYMFYYPSTMEVDIYNNYKSFDSLEGMHWFYEDEGFKKNPDPAEKTPLQAAISQAAPIVFPAYIVVALVILIILSCRKTNSFTPEQRRKLDELLKQDDANKVKNENARRQRLAQAEQYKRAQLSTYTRELAEAEAAKAEYTRKCSQMSILADEDKTLANVEFLIQKLTSGRADSLKEALNLMDEDARRRRESWMRAEMAHQEAMLRARAEDDARRDQMYHNMNVEYQQRRQADELEKIRRALED